MNPDVPPAPRRLSARDPSLPQRMRELTPPLEDLWVVGRDLSTFGPMIAIVGARDPTPYGMDVAHSLAADLAATGICIVSGMARGIDAAAHEGALSVGGDTVAVLGTGVDVAFPSSNASLQSRVAAAGTLLSEYPLRTRGFRSHFPKRNRIIAALSIGLIVVQARLHSGTRHTVDHALRLGIEVFAVPGDVRSEMSAGPHALIRDGAVACFAAEDVFTALGDRLGDPATRERPFPVGLGPEEHAVFSAVNDGVARAEQIALRAGLDVVTAARMLTRLELAGHVARAPSGVYRRAR